MARAPLAQKCLLKELQPSPLPCLPTPVPDRRWGESTRGAHQPPALAESQRKRWMQRDEYPHLGEFWIILPSSCHAIAGLEAGVGHRG